MRSRQSALRCSLRPFQRVVGDGLACRSSMEAADIEDILILDCRHVLPVIVNRHSRFGIRRECPNNRLESRPCRTRAGAAVFPLALCWGCAKKNFLPADPDQCPGFFTNAYSLLFAFSPPLAPGRTVRGRFFARLAMGARPLNPEYRSSVNHLADQGRSLGSSSTAAAQSAMTSSPDRETVGPPALVENKIRVAGVKS